MEMGEVVVRGERFAVGFFGYMDRLNFSISYHYNYDKMHLDHCIYVSKYCSPCIIIASVDYNDIQLAVR